MVCKQNNLFGSSSYMISVFSGSANSPIYIRVIDLLFEGSLLLQLFYTKQKKNPLILVRDRYSTVLNCRG